MPRGPDRAKCRVSSVRLRSGSLAPLFTALGRAWFGEVPQITAKLSPIRTTSPGRSRPGRPWEEASQARPGQARPGPSRGDPVIGRQVVCFVLSSAISALPGEARPGPAKPGQARPGRPWEEAILTLFATLGRPWEAILTLFATLPYRIDTASHELGNPGRSTASKPTCFWRFEFRE